MHYFCIFYQFKLLILSIELAKLLLGTEILMVYLIMKTRIFSKMFSKLPLQVNFFKRIYLFIIFLT